jgi:hypothetical protein
MGRCTADHRAARGRLVEGIITGMKSKLLRDLEAIAEKRPRDTEKALSTIGQASKVMRRHQQQARDLGYAIQDALHRLVGNPDSEEDATIYVC